jgi:hypothetical protein
MVLSQIVCKSFPSKENIKSVVIDVLSNSPNITAKQIFNKIKKQGISTTYHGTYDCIRKMVDDGILVREEVKYRLCPVWVDRTVTKVQNIKTKCDKDNDDIFSNASSVESVQFLTFNTFSDVSEFVIKYRNRFVETANKGDEMIWLGNHTWGPLFYRKDSRDGLGRAIKKGIKMFIGIRGNTVLDETVCKFYSDMGIENVKLNLGNLNNLITIIYKDRLLIITEPHEIVDKMEHIFQNTKSITDIDLGIIFKEVFDREILYHVFVVKNKEIVRKYKDVIKAMFGP